MLTEENRSTRRKIVPVLLCPPKVPRTRASAVRACRLTTWAMAGPIELRCDDVHEHEICLVSETSRTALGPRWPIHCVPGSLCPVVQRPRRKADKQTSFTAEVNEWICAFTPPYTFMVCKGTNLPFSLPIYKVKVRKSGRLGEWVDPDFRFFGFSGSTFKIQI